MNSFSKIGLTLGLLISTACLSGCAAMMTGMEFLAEMGECAAGVDCVQDRNGFDGIQSDDGTSAMAAGTSGALQPRQSTYSGARSTKSKNNKCGGYTACR